ncbi:hypothetical protein TNCV_181391 [Trichonephila clavipes]|nr:hypothetical protein TNCV_181391 [Trichonephila clavipes]
MHGQCPIGADSWCAYQRSKAIGEQFLEKSAGLSAKICNVVMGGRRSPKLQRQFVHLPCLQETDFLRNVGVPQVNGLYGGRSCILAQLVGQSEL